MTEAERERIVAEYKEACRLNDPAEGAPVVTFKAGWFAVRRSVRSMVVVKARARELVNWTKELRRRVEDRERKSFNAA